MMSTLPDCPGRAGAPPRRAEPCCPRGDPHVLFSAGVSVLLRCAPLLSRSQVSAVVVEYEVDLLTRVEFEAELDGGRVLDFIVHGR